MNRFFRLLNADEIECRVNQISENRLTLLLYKTARTDADILDETVGAGHWECDYKMLDGVLYGGIGVDYFSDGNYVWKWDAGTESNMEAEKGRASDAFKRAGFKHGIGRELYSAPNIVLYPDNAPITIKKDQRGKLVCYDRFDVVDIVYTENGKISRLGITANGKPCYSWASGTTPVVQKEPPKEEGPICERCGKTIKPIQKKNGSIRTVDDILNYSRDTFSADYCGPCCSALTKARNENAV